MRTFNEQSQQFYRYVLKLAHDKMQRELPRYEIYIVLLMRNLQLMDRDYFVTSTTKFLPKYDNILAEEMQTHLFVGLFAVPMKKDRALSPDRVLIPEPPLLWPPEDCYLQREVLRRACADWCRAAIAGGGTIQ